MVAVPARLPFNRVSRAVGWGVVLGVSLAHATETGPVPAPQSGSKDRFTEHARRTLDAEPKGRALRVLALNQALERELLQEAEHAISDEAVRNHYARYKDYFFKPQAIELWRLLVPTEDQAKTLLGTLQQSKDPMRTWSSLVREHSIDKATHFRRGSLGYVWPDGNTDVPQVRVSPALFAAAATLKDGELAPAPVKEGNNWALVWRRDTRAPAGKTLDEARVEVRQQLQIAHARRTYQQLVERLRNAHLREFHPERLEGFNPPPPANAEALPNKAYVARPADRSPVPRQTQLGER